MERLPPASLLIATARTGPAEPRAAACRATRPFAGSSCSPCPRRRRAPPRVDARVPAGRATSRSPGGSTRRAGAIRSTSSSSFRPSRTTAPLRQATAAPGGCTARDAPLPLPSSLRELITHRVSRLTPAGREVLEAAAVLGVPFDRDLLRDVSGISPVAVETGLEELILHRWFGTPSGGRYVLANELVQTPCRADTASPSRRSFSPHAPVRRSAPRAQADPSMVAALDYHRGRAAALTAAAPAEPDPTGPRSGGAGGRSALGGIALATRTTPAVGIVASRCCRSPSGGPPELRVSGRGNGHAPERRARRRRLGLERRSARRPRHQGAVRRVRRTSAGRAGRGTGRAPAPSSWVTWSRAAGRIRISATAYRRERPASAADPSRGGRRDRTTVRARWTGMAGRLLTELNPGPYEQLTQGRRRSRRARSRRSGPTSRASACSAAAPSTRPPSAFQRAIVEDTSFALAYYWLSVASWWADDSKAIDSAAAAAVRLRRPAARAGSAALPVDGRHSCGAMRWGRSGFITRSSRSSRRMSKRGSNWARCCSTRGRAAGRRWLNRGPRSSGSLFFEPEHTSAILHLARIAASERRSPSSTLWCSESSRLNPTG